MKYFFSCDWGTSSFRLRLVETGGAKMVSSIETGHGIASAFDGWKQAGHSESERPLFFKRYLSEQVEKISSTYNEMVHGAPVVLSGMASSSIGLFELPYRKIPFHCDGSDLLVHRIPGDDTFTNDIILISGAKSEIDVIRGEETMLAGCVLPNDAEQLLIFPGTHSKHIRVKGGKVQDINTFMTGELFNLLSSKSILSNSVEKDSGDSEADVFFIKGVKEGSASNLLNSIFHVRTNQLFKKMTAFENYHYLSGLLIGYELQEITKDQPVATTLVCGEGLKKTYLQALDVLGLGATSCLDADEVLVKGQLQILGQRGYL
ncbi:MAG: 2-keto-3-deoxy-galactonokinase [Ferruginibacter sp.]|nr:2-keto-3-deoxy-galactonokinase [Ferruginibacter sp.]